ncbi:hypothetical protein ACFC08_28675 [Streptomyces sp. NPDC056112]|uniref:hypothetical protein n=1 Tax=Streptomyces sp. NPDC056112 TaxID=3345715 RepID=UPI0035DD7060
MPTTDTPQPQAVDYSGRPLTEGDPVAFISHDPIGLAAGRIRIIGPNDLCIDTGHHLVTFRGGPVSRYATSPRPVGGAVAYDEDVSEPLMFPQVALQPTQDGA